MVSSTNGSLSTGTDSIPVKPTASAAEARELARTVKLLPRGLLAVISGMLRAADPYDQENSPASVRGCWLVCARLFTDRDAIGRPVTTVGHRQPG